MTTTRKSGASPHSLFQTQKNHPESFNRMASCQAIFQTVLFGFGYAHFKQLIQHLCLLIGNAITRCQNISHFHAHIADKQTVFLTGQLSLNHGMVFLIHFLENPFGQVFTVFPFGKPVGLFDEVFGRLSQRHHPHIASTGIQYRVFFPIFHAILQFLFIHAQLRFRQFQRPHLTDS